MHTKSCAWMFILVLFITINIWKKLNDLQLLC